MDYGPNALLPSVKRALAMAAIGLVLFAGCESVGRRDPNDVLFGGTPPAPSANPPPGRSASAVASAPTANTKPLPPLPPPGPSSTLASLAVGTNSTPENDRAPRPVTVTPVPDGSGWHGGATLHGPQPVDDPGNRITPVGATGQAGGVAAAGGAPHDGYQQIMDKLNARGRTWSRLETTSESGVWKFSCTIADRNNPGIEQRYEASGFGEDGLAAMRAVLDKIEHPEP